MPQALPPDSNQWKQIKKSLIKFTWESTNEIKAIHSTQFYSASIMGHVLGISFRHTDQDPADTEAVFWVEGDE